MSGNQPTGSNPTGQSSGGGDTTYDQVREDLADTLNKLIRLEFDVGASYESALHRTDTPAVRELLKQQEVWRGEQVSALAGRVGVLGAQPANKADAYRVIDEARVVLGNISGDTGLLAALKANLVELRDTYLATRDSQGFVPEDITVLEAGFTVADRHIRELDQLAATL